MAKLLSRMKNWWKLVTRPNRYIIVLFEYNQGTYPYLVADDWDDPYFFVSKRSANEYMNTHRYTYFANGANDWSVISMRSLRFVNPSHIRIRPDNFARYIV